MKNNPVFNIIDRENWLRKDYFEYFTQTMKCTYSITINLDIGSLLKACKKNSIKLYPAVIYMIATAVNQIDELRIGFNQAKLGTWNFMSPSYTVFHNEDKTFSKIWTQYDNDFCVFNRNYLEDVKKYGHIKNLFAKGQDPGNTFPVSCLPWIDFTGLNLNLYDDAQHFSPIFIFGKYVKQNNKTVIPVAAQLHHATCDGYHVGMLFELMKSLVATSEKWINF